MPECNGPTCPLSEVKADITEVKQDVKELGTQNAQILVIANDIKHIRDDVRELKTKVHEDHDSLFTRVRSLEESSITKKELYWGAAIVAAVITMADKILKWVGVLR